MADNASSRIADGAESGINRHFRWEALFMVALFVVPVLWALAGALLMALYSR
jgi:hypothetical protein